MVKKGHKEFISVQAIRIEQLSDEGLKHFPVHLRRFFKGNNIFRSQHKVMAFCDEISNKKKLCNFVFRTWGYGKFAIMGRSKGRTKFGNKPIGLATITIKEKDNYEGYESEFEHPLSRNGRTCNRLKRYWFWRCD